MSSWEERLEWNMVEIRKLAVINEQRAIARRAKEAKEKQLLLDSGVDPEKVLGKTSIPQTVSQSTARKMERHELDLGDICQVTAGKFADKKVLVIKAGITTKFGLKSITVEYFGPNKTGEKVWVSPEQLAFEGENDLETANAIKEADYQEWKARKQAGVPPAAAFKQTKSWKKPKQESDPSDDSFL